MKEFQSLLLQLKNEPITPESTNVRLYRAVSWLICASEQTKQPDLAFISHWIAFNALYAGDADSITPSAERERFLLFIRKLASYDEENRIYSTLWERFSGPLRLLLSNKYLYKFFWDHHRGLTPEWEGSFNRANEAALRYLGEQKVTEFMEIILDRLYILRNQLFHGGSTFRSTVNRESVKTGHQVLQLLVPAFVDIMIKHPAEEWGEVHYPLVV